MQWPVVDEGEEPALYATDEFRIRVMKVCRTCSKNRDSIVFARRSRSLLFKLHCISGTPNILPSSLGSYCAFRYQEQSQSNLMARAVRYYRETGTRRVIRIDIASYTKEVLSRDKYDNASCTPLSFVGNVLATIIDLSCVHADYTVLQKILP